jgi:hypothetical protein
LFKSFEGPIVMKTWVVVGDALICPF